MKTIKEWLETLDEPYRSQALDSMSRNSEALRADLKDVSLKEALRGAFIWSKSPQGHKYWKEYVDTLSELSNIDKFIEEIKDLCWDYHIDIFPVIKDSPKGPIPVIELRDLDDGETQIVTRFEANP